MNKIKNEEYFEFLNIEGFSQTFPKKSARILYNCINGKMTDLIVEDFYHCEEKQYLYKTYSKDFGNCLSNWDEWTFSDVLIKIFVSYNVPENLRKKILFELSKVKEWRPHLAFWIWRNWSPDA